MLSDISGPERSTSSGNGCAQRQPLVPNLTRRQAAMLAGVLLLSVVVYLRSLWGEFVYDDFQEIVLNRFISRWSFPLYGFIRDELWYRDPLHLPQCPYYRPLKEIWLYALYHLAGLHPARWHAFMIGLEVSAVALAFRAAQLLSADTAVGLLAALLFALLPVHAEAVAWITASPEILATIFSLAALCSFIRRSSGSRRGYAVPVALYFCALLSWEAAVVFPALIGLYAFLFELAPESAPDRPLGLRRRLSGAIVRSLPFLVAMLVFLAMRQGAVGRLGLLPLKQAAATTASHSRVTELRLEEVHASAAQTLSTIPRVLVSDLELLVVPWLADSAHPIEWVKRPGGAAFYVPLLIVAALIVIGCAVIRRSKRRSLYLFCTAWLILGLLPALDLGYVIAPVQDRYLYLASFGWCLLIADWVVRFARRGSLPWALASASVAAVGVLCALTIWQQQRYWHDDATLFAHCVRRCPDSLFYRWSLASALDRRGDLRGAERQLREALRLAPSDAALHLRLASVETRLGNHDEAVRQESLYLDAFPNAPWDRYLSKRPPP